MNIQEEVRINLRQPCIMADTEIGELFKVIKEDMCRRGFSAYGNIFLLMSAAYNAGMVHGKRVERARRKKRTERWEE